MIKSHKQLTASLLVSAALAVCLGVISPQPAAAASLSSSSSVTASAATAIIESSVRLRITPSTSGTVLTYLKEGEIVTILEKTNSYWYKVRTATGTVGYTSTGEQYISLISGNGGGSGTVTPVPTTPATPSQGNTIESVIAAGMKYLGTPYEFGSSRSNTNTFDCSDFIRQMFLDAANFKLPADSRQQGDWVKQKGTAVTNISALKRGDLMFFMDYKGSSASAYAGIDKSTARISHVAIYLGNGQILHTYSVASGGVRVDNLSASWMNRFLFGGSVIR
ncbi:C40 family peptidase [Paenibacillus monticola]|uniref:SH3 domain-containing protein n=1 Tax=Paenibacillus monticola TaxID=2666075 RepID=A0A7X2HBD1_9BACL|nr:C40 family peptidase [Paenibacillus monticola]MRN56984.1 SH3 domain-containing protein [Paenibacillus monticola]